MRIGISILVIMLPLLPLSGFSAVLNVPGSYATISDAVLAAGQCDTILIDSGSYAGSGFNNITLNEKCLSIISAYGSEKTFIDVENEQFLFVSDSSGLGNGDVYLEGISFFGGDSTWYFQEIGIEYGMNGSISMKKCSFARFFYTIQDFSIGGTGSIDSCFFLSNSISVVVGGNNAGVWSLTNNLFNKATADFEHLQSNAVISGNIFAYNVPGIFLVGSNNFDVRNNLYYNNGVGIGDSWFTNGLIMYCQNFYGNDKNTDYFTPGDQIGTNGNISINPKFCDTMLSTTSVLSTSPLLPENNECGVNIGNVSMGCICADLDGSNEINIGDLTSFVNYLFKGGADPTPLIAADIDGTNEVNIADLTAFVNYFFKGGPAPKC